MTSTVTTSIPPDWSAADMQKHLGGIPLERIRMVPPPGTATEDDVLVVQSRTGRICELIDGVLVDEIQEDGIIFNKDGLRTKVVLNRR